MLLLSILVPTVKGREESLEKLLVNMVEQCQHTSFAPLKRWYKNLDWYTMFGAANNIVEIIVCEDDKQITIGEKRQLLYRMAKGAYAVQIDDDDQVAPDFIQKVLKAVHESEPDVITYRENCMMDGMYKSSNHSLKYEKWQDNFDGFDYVRTPFYKDVVKTSIAQSVPFPNVRWNEDEQWSMALKPRLKTEVHIDEELYFYQYTSTDHNARYGIKVDD